MRVVFKKENRVLQKHSNQKETDEYKATFYTTTANPHANWL